MYFNKNFHCERQNTQDNQGNDFIKPIAIERMSSMRNISKMKGKGHQVLQRQVIKRVIPSLKGVMRKDGDKSYLSHCGRVKDNLTSEQMEAKQSLQVNSSSEPERKGEIFYRCCFLEVQSSGKVLHCQLSLLFKVNEYNLLPNISEMRFLLAFLRTQLNCLLRGKGKGQLSQSPGDQES